MNLSLLAINMTLPHGVYEDVVSAIGHTPLIRLNKVTADLSGSEVWAKLERCSPGGSIKDRIGLAMILEAEEMVWRPFKVSFPSIIPNNSHRNQDPGIDCRSKDIMLSDDSKCGSGFNHKNFLLSLPAGGRREALIATPTKFET